MMRYAELEGPDKDLLLIFLWELERRKMICSKLALSLDGKSTERVWYGNQSSPRTKDAVQLVREVRDAEAQKDIDIIEGRQ